MDIEVTQLTGTLYKLGASLFDQPDSLRVNVLASVGQDGILLVDTAWDQTSEKLGETIKRLGDGTVKLIILTHAHLDHYGGNATVGKEAVLIAHKNAQGELAGQYFALGKLPGHELPTITMEDELALHFNNQDIQIIYAPGHTSGDVVVYFPQAGVVCLGDLVLSDRYPTLDIGRGGNIEAYTASLGKLVNRFPADVKLVTGHGRDYTMDDLKNHYHMLLGTMQVIRQGIGAGKSLQDLVDEQVLKDWERWNSSQVTAETWIRQVCESISGQAQTSISEPLTYTIVEKDIEAAIKQYHDLKNNQPDAFNFAEGQLNTLGYHLLWRNKIAEAIQIFKLNIDAYPHSSNTYDSLGEAYLASGEQELARQYYEKALELNPASPSALEALDKLKARP